jgi:putative oxidoreductase
MLRRLLNTDHFATTSLIRLMVGGVFLSEGIQKFLFPAELGAGRFAKIGLASPEFLGNFVGCVEIICGGLIFFGFLTRIAAIPIIIIMLAAIGFTKFGIFEKNGLWKMLHETRTDWSMLLGSIFLLITGGGKWSIDRLLILKYFKGAKSVN